MQRHLNTAYIFGLETAVWVTGLGLLPLGANVSEHSKLYRKQQSQAVNTVQTVYIAIILIV